MELLAGNKITEENDTNNREEEQERGEVVIPPAVGSRDTPSINLTVDRLLGNDNSSNNSSDNSDSKSNCYDYK